MKTETTLNHIQQSIQSVKIAYSNARILGKTSGQLNSMLNTVLNDMRGKKMPRWAIERVKGYSLALKDNLYSDHLVFGCIIDGVFYSTHSDRPDYYAENGMPANIYCEKSTNNPTIGHYWKENGKPFFYRWCTMNIQKQLIELYLDYVNDFLTIKRFAEYYNLTPTMRDAS